MSKFSLPPGTKSLPLHHVQLPSQAACAPVSFDGRSIGRYLHALKQYHLTEPLYRQQCTQLQQILASEYLHQISGYCTTQNLLTHLNEVLALVTALEETYLEFSEQITSVNNETDYSEHLYTLSELGDTLEQQFFALHAAFNEVYAHYLVCTALCCLHLGYQDDLQTTLRSIQSYPSSRPYVFRYLQRIMSNQPEQRCDAFRLQSMLSLAKEY